MLDICFCVCIRQIAIWLHGKTKRKWNKKQKSKQKSDVLYRQGPQEMPHFATLGVFRNNSNWFFSITQCLILALWKVFFFYIDVLNLKPKSHYISIQNCVITASSPFGSVSEQSFNLWNSSCLSMHASLSFVRNYGCESVNAIFSPFPIELCCNLTPVFGCCDA